MMGLKVHKDHTNLFNLTGKRELLDILNKLGPQVQVQGALGDAEAAQVDAF